jgi:hypothetical protein
VYVDPADTSRPAPFLHRKFNLAKGGTLTLSTSMIIRAENRDTFTACSTNFDTAPGTSVARTLQYKRFAKWQRWSDVIELTVLSGPGQGERSYYARGLGWVGFNDEVASDLVTFNSWPKKGSYTQGSVCSSGGNNPAYHAATNQHVTGRFREFWELHGGLAVFGYPLGAAVPTKSETTPVLAQVFERMRFEYRPDLTPPYDVTLGRLGAEVLAKKGRVWQNEPPQASNAPKAGCLVPQAGAGEASQAPQAAVRKERMKERTPRVDWAELLRRTFDLDVFVCVRCGGRRRVLAYVQGGGGVRAILAHLGLPTACARLAPARGPPQAAGC